MKKHFLLTLIALLGCFASFAVYPITGPTSGCTGSTTNHFDSTSGGVWSSSNTTVATINPTTGVTYAVTAGTTTISYVVGATTVTATYTVNPSPSPITGTLAVCAGSTTTLADATLGGTWSSSNTYVATVGSGGIVSGVYSGTTTISYAFSTGCAAHAIVTVSSTFVDSLNAPSIICLGSTATLTDSTSGGVWTSGSPAIITIDPSTGVATGVAVGGSIITYTVTGACGSSSAVAYVTVSNTTGTGTISGGSSVAIGSSLNLSESVSGGTWSVAPSSIATINPTTGVLYGVAAGTANVTYSVSGCGGAAAAYHSVSVTPFDGISGTINFGSTAHYGPVKVWLITYVSPMLTAIDSTIVYAAGTTVTYQFTGEPTDSFRIKAATLDSLSSTTGFIPTYHTSSFYWNSANVLAHTSGTSDINQDINMAFGTVTTGPGFIGGNVTTGANKGTASGVPVKNLMMYVFNSTTSQLMQSVRTDASGNYSFSNLPVGANYYVFPDSLNYLTTPYTGISLTTSSPSAISASFIQHTLSHTITPIPVGVGNVSASTASILAFPNPTNGKVNIAWSLPSAQEAAVVVCDITGREVYHTTVNMNEGAGSFAADLSSLTSGLYTISVKSAAINYNNKIQVQH